MEAAIRSSAQVGGPLQPGQRNSTAGSDNGPSSQQQQQQSLQQQQSNISPYMQRISTAESPIHRPVDTPQSYAKGGIGAPPQQSRSAASPLSPPRPGPGAANTYPRFADVNAVREAPHRYVQHTAYNIGGGAGPIGSHGGPSGGGPGQIQQQYRENSYARIPQMPSQAQEYHRAVAAQQVIVSSGLPIVSVGPANTMDSLVQQAQQHHLQQQQSHATQSAMLSGRGGQRISLIPAHPSDFMANAAAVVRQPPQQIAQTPDPSGPYKKMRLGIGVGVNIGISNSVQDQPPPSQPPPHQQSQLQHQQAQQMPTIQQQINATNHLPSIVPAGATILNVSTNVAPNLVGPQQPVAIVAPLVQNASSAPPTQQLKVDTREHRPATTEAYHPQVEAISPTLPVDPIEDRRTAKDELLLQINKIDMEINETEKTMVMLKKKADKLEQASSQKLCAKTEETQVVQPKHRSMASKCYAENKKRAEDVHSTFDKLGPPSLLPLYNQPSDVETIEEQKKRHEIFKNHLLMHIKKIRQEKTASNAALIEKYTQMSQEWQKRVEKAENSAKRKAKEAKNREFFEKVFTELRKQREDKERFNRVGSRIKSEADLEEIMDGLQEQAIEEKKMRSYAVIPPLMLDVRERRFVYHNENGAMPDMINDYKERQNVNVWTSGEKEIFKEKFLQHPKNFGVIAASLDRKSAQDCVRYYYLSKKTENYKQLLRKSRQRTRSSRNPQKTGQQQLPQCIVDSLTTGVTTRLQREQQQKTGGRDRTAQSTSATTSSTTNSNNNQAAASGINGSSSSSSGGSNSNNTSSSNNTSNIGTSTVNSIAAGTIPINSNASNSNVANKSPSENTVIGGNCGDYETTDNSVSNTTTSNSSVKLGNESIGADIATINSAELGQPSLVNEKDDKINSTTSTTTTSITSSSGTTITATTNSAQSTINCVGNGLSNTTTTSSTSAVNTNSNTNVINTISNGTKSSVISSTSTSPSISIISTTTTTTLMANNDNSASNISAVNSLQATIQNSEPILIDDTSSSAAATAANNINKSCNNNSPSTNSITTTTTSSLPSSATTTIVTGGGSGGVIENSTSNSDTSSTVHTSSGLGCTSNNNNNNISNTSASAVLTGNINSTQPVGTAFSNINNSSNLNLNKSSNISNNTSSVNPYADISSGTNTTTTIQQHSINTPNGIKTELVIAANAAAAANNNSTNSTSTILSSENSGSSKNDKDSIIDDSNNKNQLSSNAGLKTKLSDIDGSDNSDVSEAKKKRLDSDASSNPAISNNDGDIDSSVTDSKDKLHPCFVCKAEACPRTRPLKKGRGQQYGISDDSIPVGARVCNSCQCKSVRSRYPNCPLPTCPNSKERAKRLHNIPAKLFDSPPEIRDPILQEFKISTTTTRCCSACLMRIRRKLDPHINLPEDRQTLTDGDESDLSTSSCDERDIATSDTASVESPNNPIRQNVLLSKDDQISENNRNSNALPTGSGGGNNIKSIDDRLLPPLGQAPRKQKTQEEYDSSATETADEENENSPAAIQNGPQRPDQQLNVRDFVFNVIEFTLKTGGPKPNSRPAAIESRSGGGTSSTGSTASNSSTNSNSNSANTDVQFVSEFRNDGSVVGNRQTSNSAAIQNNLNTANNSQTTLQPTPQNRQHPIQQNENLATLSVVNTHPHLPTQQQQIIQQHQHGISATITPVKTPLDIREKDDVIYNSRSAESEPQTLDLSIKKSSKDQTSVLASPSVTSGPTRIPSHQQTSSVTAMPIYRSESGQPTGIPQSGPSSQQGSTYLTYHHPSQPGDINRPSKSPSVYVSQVPVNISQTGQPLSRQQQQLQQNQVLQQHQQTLAMQQQQQQVQQQQQNKAKLSQQKLSPKVHPHQQSPSPNQMMVGGPKGSITHGTPVNSQQQILVQGSATLSPRFDGILRQTPPSGGNDSNKLGSITQGTPVHLPSHHMQDKRVFDYYKNNRQSPAQQQAAPPQSQTQAGPPPPSQPPNPAVSASNFGSTPYSRSAYGLEPQPQLSTRQIVMHDYMTSQQMHGQQRNVGRSEKEPPSPRSSSGISNSPASIYYTDKDRARADYLSRTSPAEHINSTPSPHRTPPPQRQGVIQRHNTGGSKPPSPSPNRLHLMPHIYPPSGHEAFNSLVDVAVQQPQLPVPQRDEKRNAHPAVDHGGNVFHHDMRSQHIAREQIAMQIHQQQQHHFRQQQQVAADMQRREQYNRERIHAQQQQERDRQERDRQERDRQERERIQAERERIDRERERERREREEQDREEARRRETARMMAASATGPGGPPPFLRTDPAGRGPVPDRERDPYHRSAHHPGRPSDGTLSAASLIDAIIKHQINQGSSDPPNIMGRDGPRPSFYSTRDQPHSVAAVMAAAENNVKSNSPNVINIDLDSSSSDRSGTANAGNRQPSSLSTHPPQPLTKSMTLGEVTDSIITKEYGPNPMHMRPAGSSYMTYLQDPIVTTDQWKYNRRMQHKEAEAAAAAERNKTVGVAGPGGRSTTPDDRQVIRMAQPPSPRNKFHEMMDGHYYQGPAAALSGLPPGATIDRRIHQGPGPSGAPGNAGGPSHQFALDCYVKNRIAEAMRTEDDRRPDDGHGIHGGNSHNLHHERNDGHSGRMPTAHGGKDPDGKITPSGYEDGRRSNSSTGGPQTNDSHRPNSSGSGNNISGYGPAPVTTFATTTYAYPYSALNVTGPPPPSSLVGPQTGVQPGKGIDGSGGSTGSHGAPSVSQQQTSLPAEPKPLLSAQYEALSDEE